MVCHNIREIIMSVKTHCRCDLPLRSSLIRVNSFIKDLNLFFKEVGFCLPCKIKQWAFVRWDIVQWAFVLVGFCPSGPLSVPHIDKGSLYFYICQSLSTYIHIPGMFADMSRDMRFRAMSKGSDQPAHDCTGLE